jgi:hypothetical protein
LPLALAERVQHAILRLEEQWVSPTIDPPAIDAAYETGRQLLEECARLLGQ